MIRFFLYDRWGDWVAPMDGITEYEITHETGGENSVEMTLVGQTVTPTKEDRIVWHDGAGWHEHLVAGVETAKRKGEEETTVYAEDSISELRRKWVEELDGGESSSSLLNTIVDGTLWYCGSQGTVKNFKATDSTAMECLVELADAQGGIIKTEIQVDDLKVTKRIVSIVQPDEDFCGLRFDYGRNVSEIARIIEEDDVYTKITAYGGTYTESELVYDPDIDDEIWKDVTHQYTCTIADESLLSTWGWPTKDGTIRHSETEWEDSSYSNENFAGNEEETGFVQAVQDALEAAAEQELASYGPRISYEADVELFGRDVNVGQKVQITDCTFSPELRLEGTVLKTVEDMEGKKVTLGTIASTLADTVLRQDKTISGLTTGNSSFWTH